MFSVSYTHLLLERIHQHHTDSGGVMGAPRMCEELGYEGETASLNRVARLMAGNGLFGVPQKRQWRRKPSGVRPAYVRNHLERDFQALEPVSYTHLDVYKRQARHRARRVLCGWHNAQRGNGGSPAVFTDGARVTRPGLRWRGPDRLRNRRNLAAWFASSGTH